MIRLPKRPVTRAAALSVAMTVVFGSALGLDTAETAGRPLEHAEVLGYELTGETVVCHKLRAKEYVATYRSDDPPPGLPATFEHDGYCDPEPAVGTVVPLVRTLHDDQVEVHTYPLRSAGEVAVTIAGFALLVFLVLWLAFAASRAHDRWRERRRAGRRQSSGATPTGTIG